MPLDIYLLTDIVENRPNNMPNIPFLWQINHCYFYQTSGFIAIVSSIATVFVRLCFFSSLCQHPIQHQAKKIVQEMKLYLNRLTVYNSCF